MILLAIKASIVFAIAASVNLLLRRHPASLRSLIWSLAIGAVLALPLLSAMTPALHLLPARQVRAADDEAVATDSHVSNEGAVVPSGTSAATMDMPPVAAGAAPTMNAEQTLIALWVLGALLFLARFVSGSVRARRLAQRADVVTDESWLAVADRAAGRDSPVELRMSAEVDMPFACGFLNPVVVIPASSAEWDTQRRETVLLHEFAHLSRGDLVMNTLSHLSRALYWFNPLAWYASHRLRIETERACDDAVLRRGARASEYADHLLSIASRAAANVPTAALAMARPSAFEGRLLAILEPSAQRTGLTRVRVAITSAACLMFIVPLAAASPTAPSPMMHSQEPAAIETAQERPAPQAANAVAALTEALGDASIAVRLAAVGSLGSLEDPRAIAALGKTLREDTDPRVRQAAAEALGRIDDPRAVPHLLDGLRAEKVVAVRVAIVESLHEIEDPSALSALIGAARDPSVEVRRAVVNALGDFEDQSALPAIMGMARDDDVEVRRHVASALGNLENPQSLDALAAMTRDTDAEVRANAVNALGNLEDRRSLNALVAALRDSNAEVRSNAANAIQNIDDLETAPPALIAALGDTDADVRHNVAHALGSIGDEAAVPALKRTLTDTNVEVRRAVAEALADIGGVEAINALMGLLKDPDAEIRRTAAEALGKRR